jgi:hypothetical protein
MSLKMILANPSERSGAGRKEYRPAPTKVGLTHIAKLPIFRASAMDCGRDRPASRSAGAEGATAPESLRQNGPQLDGTLESGETVIRFTHRR